jgi:hypothetical protein
VLAHLSRAVDEISDPDGVRGLLQSSHPPILPSG